MKFTIEELPEDSKYRHYFKESEHSSDSEKSLGQREGDKLSGHLQNDLEEGASGDPQNSERPKETDQKRQGLGAFFLRVKKYFYSKPLYFQEILIAGAIFFVGVTFIAAYVVMKTIEHRKLHKELKIQQERVLLERQNLLAEVAPFIHKTDQLHELQGRVTLSRDLLLTLFEVTEALDGETYITEILFEPVEVYQFPEAQKVSRSLDVRADGKLKINGVAPNSRAVIDLLERLEARDFLAQLDYEELLESAENGGKTAFTLRIHSLAMRDLTDRAEFNVKPRHPHVMEEDAENIQQQAPKDEEPAVNESSVSESSVSESLGNENSENKKLVKAPLQQGEKDA